MDLLYLKIILRALRYIRHNFNSLYFELKITPKSNLWYSRAECNEKLLKIQFGVLRERDLDPQWRLKVIDIHVERSESIVIFATEIVVCFAETVLVHGRRTICSEQQRFFWTIYFLDSHIHLGKYGTRDRKLGINIDFRW